MGQYIAFEAAVSSAGAKADIRVRATPAQQAAAAWVVAAKIAQAKGLSLPQGAVAENPGLKAAALSAMRIHCSTPLTHCWRPVLKRSGLCWRCCDQRYENAAIACRRLTSSMLPWGPKGQPLLQTGAKFSDSAKFGGVQESAGQSQDAYDAVVVVGVNPAYHLPGSARGADGGI